MTYLICPGIHDRKLTESFLEGLKSENINLNKLLILPVDRYPPYSAFHIFSFLEQQLKSQTELTVISFSAGVVGAIGAASKWQQQGNSIRAFMALDGWGVPLRGDFPIYRLSHDYFTHWSSALLGGGDESFYADPPVDHLDLWRSPAQVPGWHLGKGDRSRTTAAAFLAHLLNS
ncbi:conserved hypothetical protein [Gloeothece citriformis PCC 7424]|uniref:Alpha/beta hydrolase n=1 Tax=Gloeothece citriformis (strain PCC 7424) TaxID=65393 RepID=B7KIC8_GLOC7|nr:hypothetical protein [Gloeothece citriformis]ACK73615.1 conserved hypothetical protein [Gloeothece citriformis PCC 7424]